LFKSAQNSTGARTQGFLLPQALKLIVGEAPACSQCQVYAERYRDAVVNWIGGWQELPIARFAAMTNKVGKTANVLLGTSLSIDGFINFIPAFLDLDETWQKYLDCIGGFLQGVTGCPPILEGPFPNPIEKTEYTGGQVQFDVTLKNIGKRGEAGLLQAFFELVTNDPIRLDFDYLPNYARILVRPEESGQIVGYAVCPNTPKVLTGTLRLVHNAQGAYVDVPIKITCEARVKLVAAPDPLQLVAAINSSTTGDITIESKGVGNLRVDSISGVTLPLTGLPNLAGAKLEIPNNPAPGGNSPALFIAPGSNAKVGITGTCGSTVGTLTGTITISSNDPSSPEKQVGITLKCRQVETIFFALLRQWGGCSGNPGGPDQSDSTWWSTLVLYSDRSASGNNESIDLPKKTATWAGCQNFTRNYATTERPDERDFLSPSTITSIAQAWETYAKSEYKLINPRWGTVGGITGYIAEVVKTTP
jgi:hypothetical protein